MSFWSWFSVFKEGGSSGNIPSPRYDLDIDLNTITKSTVQGSNSMEPLLDIGHTILLNYPEKISWLNVGDIIVYNNGVQDIIHSIIEISSDRDGWYCKAQGLNLNKPDIGKIRYPQIRWVCVGVLWTDKFASYMPSDGD